MCHIFSLRASIEWWLSRRDDDADAVELRMTVLGVLGHFGDVAGAQQMFSAVPEMLVAATEMMRALCRDNRRSVGSDWAEIRYSREGLRHTRRSASNARRAGAYRRCRYLR